MPVAADGVVGSSIDGALDNPVIIRIFLDYKPERCSASRPERKFQSRSDQFRILGRRQRVER
jgi:hypothetical protein